MQSLCLFLNAQITQIQHTSNLIKKPQAVVVVWFRLLRKLPLIGRFWALSDFAEPFTDCVRLMGPQTIVFYSPRVEINNVNLANSILCLSIPPGFDVYVFVIKCLLGQSIHKHIYNEEYTEFLGICLLYVCSFSNTAHDYDINQAKLLLSLVMVIVGSWLLLLFSLLCSVI